jgi:hypothetical protein
MRPRWPEFLSGALLFAAIVISARFAASETTKDSQARPDQKNVSCRVLESHTSSERGVTIVIFHQSAKEDQERLSNLLKENEGETVEWRRGDAQWQAATVLRLKSCFGRGLLILPAASAAPKEGETFLLKFPEAKTATVK